MQYLLLAHGDESEWQTMSDDERRRGAAAFGAYVSDLTAEGVLVGNYRPEPSITTKTVSIRDELTQVRDGPHVTGREHLSGVYVIDVPDADTALRWAIRNPAARFGSVEVRPVAVPPG